MTCSRVRNGVRKRREREREIEKTGRTCERSEDEG